MQQTLTLDDCDRLLSRLMSTKEAKLYFNIPVDPYEEDVEEYRSIVKVPMDLGTIQQRLFRESYRTHKYDNADEVIADIRLVFANCRAFNLEESDIGQAGLKLSHYFERLLLRRRTAAATAPNGRIYIDLVGNDDHPIITRISISQERPPKKRLVE